ncbi:PREDICTED: coiled-coil domain-containing protein 149-like isoform X2 [Priapulus caudatus]|uniref:Coiled-coil domain-containing protein 149-like isoform X2 n=1 Tax=Priapulus caudatus TaxID=37621 RepID=A0ABM1DVY5_PRICU|nr:PREDICTED: coiled-coil domain-containing protein 149-like isoform X2 [Priapulus caudatus]
MNQDTSHNILLQNVQQEMAVLKQRLASKVEALLILSKDLNECRSERDQFRLMAEQLRDRYSALKKRQQDMDLWNNTDAYNPCGKSNHAVKDQGVLQLLCEMKEHNKTLQFEVDSLKQKLSDAQGDIKLLREQIARHRVGTVDEGVNTRHFPAHEREDLVSQLEASREQYCLLERDLQTVLDEKEELVTERDAYKHKVDRLNRELNYVLQGDEKRIVDIDSLTMENMYLKERVSQLQEEMTMAVTTVTKYKNALDRRKNKGILKLGASRPGSVIISQRQVQQLLQDSEHAQLANTAATVSDLRALAIALFEAVNDKNVALSHQRKTNKILGERVTGLETKLKNLEISGFWTQKARYQELKLGIPEQVGSGSVGGATGGGDRAESRSPDDLRRLSLVSDDGTFLTEDSQELELANLMPPDDNDHVLSESHDGSSVDLCASPYLDDHVCVVSVGGAVWQMPAQAAGSNNDLDLLPSKEEANMTEMKNHSEAVKRPAGFEMLDKVISPDCLSPELRRLLASPTKEESSRGGSECMGSPAPTSSDNMPLHSGNGTCA